MITESYDLALPVVRDTSVIFSSPHSGRRYTAGFLAQTQLDSLSIRSSEDAFVDMLFEPAPKFGAPLIAALAPRAFIDLNRAVDELDPAVIDGVSRGMHNPRVSSGLGIIPRVVANGRAIYHGKIGLRMFTDYKGMVIDDGTGDTEPYWFPYTDDKLANARKHLAGAPH